MKSYYENRTRYNLPRRTYTIIRIDGKAFHTYTKGLESPFDLNFISDMDTTAKYLCENIQGAKLAFVQSDEISILLTDFDKLETDAWFDGNIQKITSVSASLATAKFNNERYGKLAHFDSRVFTIPEFNEVINYFIWRQQDTIRNSISSVAQSLYSHKELHGKNTDQQKAMSLEKGIDWDSLGDNLKYGRVILKEKYDYQGAERTKWVSKGADYFIDNKDLFKEQIPTNL